MTPGNTPAPVGPDHPGPGSLLGGRPRHLGLWLALMVVASILTQGYLVGIINHGLQLPLIRHFAGDPAFDHDPFITDMAHTYTTAFYPAVGWLASFLPLPFLLFSFFVLFRAGTVFLGYRIGLAVFADGFAALWTAAALTVQTLTFSLDLVSDIYLTHGALAQVLALLSLLLFVRGRTVWAFVVGGVLLHFHAMHAVHLMAVLGLVTLLSQRRHALVPLAQSLVLVLILAIPNVLWMQEAGVLGAPVPPGYADAIRGWFPTHFWPSTWGAGDWFMLLLPLVAGFPLKQLAGATQDGGRLWNVAWLSFVLGMLGGLLTELFPSALLIRLHPMRLSWLMMLAALPFFARGAVQALRHLERPDIPGARVAGALGAMMLMGLGVSTLYRSPYWLTLVPALWLVAFWEHPRIARLRPLLVLALVVAAFFVPWAMMASQEMESGLPRPSVDATPRNFYLVEGLVTGFAVVSILASYLVHRWGPYRGYPRRVLLQSAFLLAAVHLTMRGAFMDNFNRKGGLAQWREAQQWCAQNLPMGATLMVPLTQIGLRAFSNQVPAVDFQEGDALFHNPAYMPIFIEKLRRYGWEPGEIIGFSHLGRLDALDEQLDTAHALELAASFHAPAAIRKTNMKAWDLPELFRNRDFVIYRMER